MKNLEWKPEMRSLERRIKMKSSALLLGLGAAAAVMTGCAGTGSEPATGTTEMHLSMGLTDTADVAGIRFRVTPVDCRTGIAIGPDIVVVRPIDDVQIPGGIDPLENNPLDPSSAHSFADLFVTLAAGCYDVAASPVTTDGWPSRVCAAALKRGVVVREGETTEVFLINQCHGKDPGNLDTIAALNFEPVIQRVFFPDSKFVQCGEQQVVCATAVDPDGDPIEFAWTVDPVVADEVTGPAVISTTTDHGTDEVTQCVSFTASDSGKFPVNLLVFDLLSKDGHLVRIEDFLAAEGYPGESHASNNFSFFATCPSCSGKTDVVLLTDLSGSAADDLPIVKASAGPLFDALVANAPDAHLGVASFIDKPLDDFGAPTDHVFRIAPGGMITDNKTTFVTAVQVLFLGAGLDEKEAQIEALMHIGTHATELGYRADSQRFAILTTDEPFHVAGDCLAPGKPCTRANDGNASIDLLEDYPSLDQVANALIAAKVTPIFAVVEEHMADYQKLSDDLTARGVRPGRVVRLEHDSSNITKAVLEGLGCPTP